MADEKKNATWQRHEEDGQIMTKRPNGTVRIQTVNKSESRTVQADVENAEIKNILRRYEGTGVLDMLQRADLQFKDVSEFQNLSDALQQLKQAEAEFMQMPPQIRDVFDNDAAVWLDSAHDGLSQDQSDRLHRLGLLDRVPPPPANPAVPPADPPSAPEEVGALARDP